MGATECKPSSASAGAKAAPSACPVPEEVRNSKAVYNVYNQRIDPGACPKLVRGKPFIAIISQPSVLGAGRDGHPVGVNSSSGVQDPRNNMPIEPNQQPFPGQRKPISTERETSSIPKGGTESTWVYPSPQMFYNGGQLSPSSCLRHEQVSVCSVSAGTLHNI